MFVYFLEILANDIEMFDCRIKFNICFNVNDYLNLNINVSLITVANLRLLKAVNGLPMSNLLIVN